MLKLVNKLSKAQKSNLVIFILGFLFLLSIAIPTLSRYRNKNVFPTISVWDGTVASDYKGGQGTSDDPYLISNGSELAYLSSRLLEGEEQDKYFKLTKDIVLNKGVFSYNSDLGFQYYLDEKSYYLDGYLGKYYEDEIMEKEVGEINFFPSLDSFKGNFDGDGFTIYGLYVADEEEEELGLFTNLQGQVSNLFLDNILIYGGTYTGGLASTTNQAEIKKVLVDGYVIGKNDNLEKEINVSLGEKTLILDDKEGEMVLNSLFPLMGGEILSSSLSGTYTINGNEDWPFTINDIEIGGGSFNLDLGTTKVDNVLVAIDIEEEVTIEFSDLNYNIIYCYGLSSGIVGLGKETILDKVINKASVYGHTASGGLLGVSLDKTEIEFSYNSGKVNSNNYSGGLIGVVEQNEKEVSLSQSYNIGEAMGLNSGGLIGAVYNNPFLSFNNVLEDSLSAFAFGIIANSNGEVNNLYYTNDDLRDGSIEGLNKVTSEALRDKEFLTETMEYWEFVDEKDLIDEVNKVWVYEEDLLPVLYFDSLNDPVVNIHVSRYSWNNFRTKIKDFNFFNNITFSIEKDNELKVIKEKYYYLASQILEKEDLEEIDWVLYEGIEKITNPGSYIIYAKVIDHNDNIIYLNTDWLNLEETSFVAKINGNDKEWQTFKTNLNYIYIKEPEDYTVAVNEELPVLHTVKYYLANDLLDKPALENLEDTKWALYDGKITIEKPGQHIIYLQVIDELGAITYLNTDYIVFSGYQVDSLILGRETTSYLEAEPCLTSKSIVTYNFTSLESLIEDSGDKSHNLISNLLLPEGTKIILKDNFNNKVYSYITTNDNYNYDHSCDGEGLECEKVATYPFSLFKKLGTTNEYFVESNEEINNEHFTVILDFLKADVKGNYEGVYLALELFNNNQLIRTTFVDSFKEFNLYNETDASLSLTTNYNGEGIIYNSDSTTKINLVSKIDYKLINNKKIIDTTYENKEMGLLVKIVDQDNKVVDREHLKNLIFKRGEKKFYPGDDHLIRVKLNSGFNDFNGEFTIITKEAFSSLKEGIYHLKIFNYLSDDGYYFHQAGPDVITIPLIVNNETNSYSYGFDVLRNEKDSIITRDTLNYTPKFDLLYYGDLEEPNLRVSLYKKESLTAYNQNYILVDLQEHVEETLGEASFNTYYITDNPVSYIDHQGYNHFELNLIVNKFKNTGYKFVFELYDNDIKVGEINKYFLVK